MDKTRDHLLEDIISDAIIVPKSDSIVDLEFLSTGGDVDPCRRRRRRPSHHGSATTLFFTIFLFPFLIFGFGSKNSGGFCTRFLVGGDESRLRRLFLGGGINKKVIWGFW